MSRLTVAAQTVKDSVSALDVGRSLGLDIDRHGRCPCPFHAGRDRNLKLFEGNRGYSCFVCHETGDVIRFVQKYNNVGFKEAIAWLDSIFHLGLNINSPADPEKQKRAEMALQARKNQHEIEEWKRKMQFDLALMADRIAERFEEVRDEHRPRTYGNWDNEFYMAVRLLPEAKAFAEECTLECIEVRNE